MLWRCGQWARALPRPSRWTLLLLLVTALAHCWFWLDRQPWVVARTFPPGTSSLAEQLSPDRSRLLVGSVPSMHGGLRGDLQLYDLQSGRRICLLVTPDQNVSHTAISPSNDRIVTVGPRGAGKSAVTLWDAIRGNTVIALEPLADGGRAFFSPDGRRLITADTKRAVLYDAASGKRIRVLEENGGVGVGEAVYFSADSSMAALRMDSHRPVRIFSSEDGHLLHEYRPSTMTANRTFAAFSPDGATLAYGNYGSLHLINTATGNTSSPPLKLPGNFEGLWMAPDGRRIIALTSGGMGASDLTAVDLANGQALATTRAALGSSPDRLEWSPDRQQVVLTGWAGFVEVLNALTLKSTHQFNGKLPANSPNNILSPDGSRAATIDRTGYPHARVEFFDASTWSATSAIDERRRGYIGHFRDVAFIGDAAHVLTATDIGQVHLWRRRRPEAWWGVAALPAFWVAAIATVLFVAGALRDVRRHHRFSRA